MLAHLRHTHLRRTSCSSWPAAIRSRRLASASVVHEEEVEENDDTRGSRGDEGVGSKDPKYGVWLETEGKKYEQPYRPRNWLGGEVPFPLNRSFKPPTPLSDQLRTIIYNEYMSNPAVYTVRKLSERHSISLKRVDAILRLKGLEEHWKKNKPVQTGFLAGMEEILGISQDFTWERRTAVDMLGEDATEADMQMDADEHNRARERYQRLFWEPVVEGQEPILPKELESHRAEGRKNARAAQGIKAAHASLPPRTHEERVVDVSGRPSVTFVDVGGKFVDVDDSVRRLKEAGRRSKLRMQKRQRKEEASRRARAVN